MISKLHTAASLLKTSLRIFRRGPYYLIIFITGRCNLRCEQCFYWENISNANSSLELDLTDYKNIAQSLPNLIQLTVTGGEPFIRTEIADIIECFIKYSSTKFVTICTNGFYTVAVSKTMEHLLSKFPQVIFRISVSLDGFEQTHNSIRGSKQSYSNAHFTIGTLSSLKNKFNNLRVDITTVLTKKNQLEMVSLINFIKKTFEIDNHTILYPRGNIQNENNCKVNISAFNSITKNTKKTRRRKNYSIPFLSAFLVFLRELKEEIACTALNTNRLPYSCQAGKSLIEIDELGNVFPCETIEPFLKSSSQTNSKFFGNIRKYNGNVHKLLQSDGAKKLLQFIRNKHCACSFECGISASLTFHPVILLNTILKLRIKRLRL